MKILIAYASSEGQTAKICRKIETQVSAAGHDVTMFDTGDRKSNVHMADFDRVILAGSVHQQRHQEALEVFMVANAANLEKIPNLLVSVSLSAAYRAGRDEAQSYVDLLIDRTGVTPGDVHLAAGAIRTGEYDFFSAQIIRHLILPGKHIDPNTKEHEFTDWERLKERVATFLA